MIMTIVDVVVYNKRRVKLVQIRQKNAGKRQNNNCRYFKVQYSNQLSVIV